MNKNAKKKRFKQLLAWVLTVLMCLTVLPVSERVVHAEGTATKWTDEGNYSASLSGDPNSTAAVGSAENPYLIRDAKDLACITAKLNYASAFEDKFVKIADGVTEIDLSAHEWVPIGVFNGNFDGNGATIKGLRIGSEGAPDTTTANVGFINLLGDAATVKNLTVEVAIYTNFAAETVAHHLVGGIAGQCKGTVDNCTVKGSISAKSTASGKRLEVGGIAGDTVNAAIITNCINQATISAEHTQALAAAGGIVGYTSSSSDILVNCGNLGAVTAKTIDTKNAFAGGIVGAVSANATTNGINLLNCYNIGSITATGNASSVKGSIAGQAIYSKLGYLYWLEGTATGIIGNSTTTTNTKGTDAETVAKTSDELKAMADTLNVNIASIKADTSLGESITSLELKTWAVGADGYPVPSSTASEDGGGTGGGNEDGDDTGSGGGTEGGDIGGGTGEGGDTESNLWTAYASTQLNGADGATAEAGTAENPYLIQNAADLALLAKSYNTADATKGKYFKIADGTTIDLSAHEWVPIAAFSGNFDGNGATIEGLKIGSAEAPYETIGDVGLFAYVSGGSIKNLTAEVAIYTKGDTSEASGSKRHIVGGIVGTCTGATVDRCIVTGTIDISGSGYQQLRVAGIAGTVQTGAAITNCVNKAAVIANGTDINTFAGGIAGYMQEQAKKTYIVNCSNEGTITAESTSGKTAYAGGIVAATAKNSLDFGNYLYNCYNAGTISTAGAATAKAGSIAGQAHDCSLSYLYWQKDSAGKVFGSAQNNNSGAEVSTDAMTAEALKHTDFLASLTLNASKLNESSEEFNAYKWVTDSTTGYPVPGSEKATDKTLTVTVNSDRMGSVKVEVKAPGSEIFTEVSNSTVVANDSTVRLTPQPISGGTVFDSMTVNGAAVTLTDGYYEFILSQSSTAEVVFVVDESTTAGPIYVNPQAETSGDGTSAQTPFKTLAEAKEKLQVILTAAPAANVTVYLMGGIYELESTLDLELDQAYFGRISFVDYPEDNETPVITSGHKIPAGSFTKVEGKEYYSYQLSAGAAAGYPAFRDLLVDGERAILARTKDYTYVKSYIDEVASGSTVTSCGNGWYISKEALNGITNENLNGVELGGRSKIKSHFFHGGSIGAEDAASGEVLISAKDNEWQQFTDSDTNKRVLTGRNYWLQNHMNFLDEPGEFYYDQTTGTIYYYPYVGQDMTSAVIEYATLDTLIDLGDATNITFDGINFTGTTANYITQNGLVALLGCTIDAPDNTTDTGDHIPISAILGKNAEGIQILNCTFEELGGSAIVFTRGVKELQVTGNKIKDIAMAGILVGKNQRSWNQNGLIGGSEEVTISNNYITNIGLVVYGAPGIRVARAKNLAIQHNTIIHVPYSGIMAGFGWNLGSTEAWHTNLVNADISYNYVEDYLYKINDGGGIYTCGANDFAANSELINKIHHNYVRSGAHNNTYTGIYHDGSASNWHTYENVVDDVRSRIGPMFFQDDVANQNTHNITAEKNYTTTSNITTSAKAERNIVLKDNVVFADRTELMADETAAAIVNGAGLEAAYKHLIDPMDMELRIADATMHYVVDSTKENTIARIELTNNSDETRTFILSLTDALPNYVSCQLAKDGKVTLEAGKSAVIEAEFVITDKSKFVDTEDSIVGFKVEDNTGREVLYPRAFTVCASTGEARIAYGTPTLDGVMDEAYLESSSIKVGDIFNWWSYDKNLTVNKHANELRDAASDLEGYARLLWDENYLYCYLYIEEKDGAVISRGIDYINSELTSATGQNGLWKNESAELYIYTNHVGNGGTKYAVDAFGVQRYGHTAPAVEEHAKLPYITAFTYNGEIVEGLEIKKPTQNQEASTADKPVNGYVIEMTLPIKECSDLAVAGTPQAGDKIRFQMQNNDVDYLADKEEIHIVSLHTVEKEYLLVKENISAPMNIEIDNIGSLNSGVKVNPPAEGWVEGNNTFTIGSEKACVVLVSHDGGVTYERLAATAVDGDENCYSFTAENVTADTQITVAVAGDVNGDGKVSTADAVKLRAASLEKATVDYMYALIGDVNGDNKLSTADAVKVRATSLGKTSLGW